MLCVIFYVIHRYLQVESSTNDPASGAATAPAKSLADRLGKLDAATQDWKKRVGPTDAVKFSVAGRMERDNNLMRSSSPLTVPVSPLADRKKKTPRPARFRSKTGKSLKLCLCNH